MNERGIYFPAIIHTDGACSGNPGPGGFAAIIESGDCRITVTGGDPDTTNNRMELSAVIEALRLVNSDPDLRYSHLTIRSDSQYIVKAFQDNWIENWQSKGWRTADEQPVANKDLWEALMREAASHPTRWIWVKAHNGDPMNEECNRLAVEQATIAPNQPAYWSSAGNPLSTVQVKDTPITESDIVPPPSDPEALLGRTAELVENALDAMRQGKSWKTSSLLENALQEISTHRKLNAAAADGLPF